MHTLDQHVRQCRQQRSESAQNLAHLMQLELEHRHTLLQGLVGGLLQSADAVQTGTDRHRQGYAGIAQGHAGH